MTAEQNSMAPVLHRRILGEGPRSAGCPGDLAGDTRRLRDARVVVADNVAEFFYGPDSPEHWQLARNLPTLLPRGARADEGWFIEWQIPARSSLTAYGATMILTGALPRHSCWLDVRSGPEAMGEDDALAATLDALGYAHRTRWLLTVRCFEALGDGPVVALPETGYLPLDEECRAFWHDNADLLLLDRGRVVSNEWPPVETILDLNEILPLAALACALSQCANVTLIERGGQEVGVWHALSFAADSGRPREQLPVGQFGWVTDGRGRRPIWRLRPR